MSSKKRRSQKVSAALKNNRKIDQYLSQVSKEQGNISSIPQMKTDSRKGPKDITNTQPQTPKDQAISTHKDTVVTRTWPGTPAAPSLSDTGERSGTRTRQSEAREQEAALKIPKPGPSNSEKRDFTFNFGKTKKSPRTAVGELHESIYSALRAHNFFCRRMQNRLNRHIIVHEDKTIEGYINLGMPLKYLPPGSHCTITVGQKISDQEEGDQILRHCENPDIDYILFHVVAVGKTTKTITKLTELHETSCTLCIYASKGETLQEALCKDGRFRSDLEELEWTLWAGHKNIYEKESPVEIVAGKVLELDMPEKQFLRKGTQKKKKQGNDNATDDTRPRARVRSEGEAHEPEKDGETEDAEHDRGEGLPPRSPGHDIKGKRRRTMARIRKYYDDRCRIKKKYVELTSRPRQRPHQSMSYLTDSNLGTETADLWLKNIQILGIDIRKQYPNFRKEALQMKKYFKEERREENLTKLKQFNIYEKYFGKVTPTSTSVENCKHLIHLSVSVGFMTCEHNGRRVHGTCFVFNEGYIFTCRHVIQLMLGEGQDLRLWPDISQYVRVTFTYEGFCPSAADWFSVEQRIQVSDDNLDYAILKLRDNGKGFPPGLVGQISPPPSYGLVHIIGHPEGQNKKIDNCAVIPLQKRLEKYPEKDRHALRDQYSAILNACPMFTKRSFLRELWRSDTLSYDTCFADGSSGAPVFSASGKLVAVHTVGHYDPGIGNSLVEYGYSMQAVLCDIKQKNESLYKVLMEKQNGNPHEESLRNESSLQEQQAQPMEY